MSLRSRRILVAAAALAVLAVVVALVASCGDDSLSERELKAQASAICAEAAAATDRIAVPARPSEGRAFLARGLAVLRPAARRLAALKAPEELRDRYERAVELAREEIALIARHERLIARGEDVIDTFRRLADELDPLLTRENAYWRALGLPACVRR